MKLKNPDLKEFLDEKVELYNRPAFIESHPISIPLHFTKKQDIEMAGLLAATIPWGNSKMILRNANRMMELLDHSPYEFIMNQKQCSNWISICEKWIRRILSNMILHCLDWVFLSIFNMWILSLPLISSIKFR